jgi:hypothetical protein
MIGFGHFYHTRVLSLAVYFKPALSVSFQPFSQSKEATGKIPGLAQQEKM